MPFLIELKAKVLEPKISCQLNQLVTVCVKFNI